MSETPIVTLKSITPKSKLIFIDGVKVGSAHKESNDVFKGFNTYRKEVAWSVEFTWKGQKLSAYRIEKVSSLIPRIEREIRIAERTAAERDAGIPESYVSTLLRLTENQHLLDDEEAERLQGEQDEIASQRYDREARVDALIRRAVAKTGLTLADERYAVNYNEEDGREVTIKIDDAPTLEQLQALASLGSNLKVSAAQDFILHVTLTVAPGIENARITEGEVVPFKKKPDPKKPDDDDDPEPFKPAIAKRAVAEGRKKR